MQTVPHRLKVWENKIKRLLLLVIVIPSSYNHKLKPYQINWENLPYVCKLELYFGNNQIKEKNLHIFMEISFFFS